MREPVVADMFYPKDFEELNAKLKESFLGKRGPAVFPAKRTKDIKVIISPHAGYTYSGECAAWAHKEVGESIYPDLFVMLGPNHTGLGEKVSVSLDDWKTPLGVIKNETRFAKELLKNPLFKHNEEAHVNEHSIEVQLPFLQYSNKDKIHDLYFVPIALRDLNLKECREVAETIEKVAEEQKKNIIIIASSDFMHYGIKFHYVPFIDEIAQNIYDSDAKAIEFIKNLDTEGFYNHVEQTKTTICGYLPITIAIDIAKLRFAKSGELINYYTSGDITGNFRNSVSYAAIVIK